MKPFASLTDAEKKQVREMRFKEQTKDVNEASRLLEEEKIKKQQWAEWFGTKIPEIEKNKIKEWREKFGFYSKDDQKR